MRKNLKKLFRSCRTKFCIQFNKILINVDINFIYPIFFVATPYVDISISDKIMLSDVSNEIIYLFQIDTLESFEKINNRKYSNLDYIQLCRLIQNSEKLFRSCCTKFWIQCGKFCVNLDINFGACFWFFITSP